MWSVGARGLGGAGQGRVQHPTESVRGPSRVSALRAASLRDSRGTWSRGDWLQLGVLGGKLVITPAVAEFFWGD